MKWINLMSIAVVLAFALASAHQPTAVPAEALTVAARAAEQVRFGWRGPSKSRDTRIEEFVEAMSELEALVPGGAILDEEANLESKLLVIARDRAQHPERYAEIRRMYIEEPVAREAAMEKPTAHGDVYIGDIDEAHLAPEYRLAWEYELMMPLHASAQPKPVNLPLVAVQCLARIGDERSLTTIRVACQSAFDPENQHIPAIGRFSAVVEELLGGFRTPQAVAVAAEAIALKNAQLDVWSQASPESASVIQLYRYTPERISRTLELMSQSRPQITADIRTAIESATADGLTPEAQTALADIKAAAAEAFANDPP